MAAAAACAADQHCYCCCGGGRAARAVVVMVVLARRQRRRTRVNHCCDEAARWSRCRRPPAGVRRMAAWGSPKSAKGCGFPAFALAARWRARAWGLVATSRNLHPRIESQCLPSTSSPSRSPRPRSRRCRPRARRPSAWRPSSRSRPRRRRFPSTCARPAPSARAHTQSASTIDDITKMCNTERARTPLRPTRPNARHQCASLYTTIR